MASGSAEQVARPAVHKNRLRHLLWAVPVALALLVATQIASDVPVETLKPTLAGGPSRFLAVHGLSVHYRDEGSGPPLVLLHGTGSSLHTWDGFAAALAPHFRVVRMDLPGFGLTGPIEGDDYRIDRYVEFVEEFRKALGMESFALAGNSLGGLIGWRYAAAHPAQVSALVLLDSAGFHIDKPALVFKLARVPGLNWLLTKLDPRALVEKTIHDCYGDQRKVTPELVERYQQLSLRAGNRRAFVARAALPQEDRTSDLAGLRVRTLVLWGREDRIIPVEHAQRFASAIPGARLIVYDGVGHVPMEEIPERSAADAEAFLAEARR